MIRKVRLYGRLLMLAVKLYTTVARSAVSPFGRAWMGRLQVIFSEVEAVHRDLGHDHDPDIILARHRGPQ